MLGGQRSLPVVRAWVLTIAAKSLCSPLPTHYKEASLRRNFLLVAAKIQVWLIGFCYVFSMANRKVFLLW